jgi:exopolysaccharide biosynthesis polyprenyl glycosylphosphotransferase
MDLAKRNSQGKYLLLVDLICIVISLLLATWIRYGKVTDEWLNNLYAWASIILLLLYIVIYYLYDTHSNIFKRGFLDELTVVIKINCILMVISTAIMFLFQEGASYSRLFFFCFFLINILLTYIVRQYFKVLLLAVYRKSASSKKIMIITTSDQIRSILHRFRSENDWDYQITYLTILDKCMVGQVIEEIEVKADFVDMFEVAKQQVIDGVFIHIPNDCPLNLDLEETILEFENMGITVNLSINTFGLKIHEKIVQRMSGYHVLTFSSKLFDDSQLIFKRMIDIIGGLVGCFLTIILTIFIAPAIIIESPGPIVFSQVRVGKNGRRFRIYKFRSMHTDAEARQQELMVHNEMNGFMFKMTDDPRITKVGKFLRKTSLDEFPQFLNILKGDMSLVGTRPPTEHEFLQYEGKHRRRLALKSGLTGLWQVSGRSDITDFEEVVKLDLEYIDNWSIMMDIKILFKTVWVVLFGRGSR